MGHAGDGTVDDYIRAYVPIDFELTWRHCPHGADELTAWPPRESNGFSKCDRAIESREHQEFGDDLGAAPATGSRMEADALTDIMSPEKRSALMSRIKGKHTGPERTLRSALRKAGYRPIMHDRRLPGRPDFVFWRARIVVFVDGDFWHGWHFDRWRQKLTPAWEAKIAANIERDRRNFRKLRACGWSVVRIWEHQIETDLDKCVERVAVHVDAWRSNRPAR